MIQDNIENFKGGWFVGDFKPSLFKNPFFEVAHHKHKKGQETFPHYHKVTHELNYIVRGELMVNGKHLKEGDMWIYEPHEVSDVENLTDNELVVVRWPSIPSDKHKARRPENKELTGKECPPDHYFDPIDKQYKPIPTVEELNARIEELQNDDDT